MTNSLSLTDIKPEIGITLNLQEKYFWHFVQTKGDFFPQHLSLLYLWQSKHARDICFNQFYGIVERLVVIIFLQSSTAADGKPSTDCYVLTLLDCVTLTIKMVSVLQVLAWCVTLALTFLIGLLKKKIREQNQYIPFVSIALVNTDCNQQACTLTHDFSLPALFACNSIVIFQKEGWGSI